VQNAKSDCPMNRCRKQRPPAASGVIPEHWRSRARSASISSPNAVYRRYGLRRTGLAEPRIAAPSIKINAAAGHRIQCGISPGGSSNAAV
jgi:hypothetical protein